MTSNSIAPTTTVDALNRTLEAPPLDPVILAIAHAGSVRSRATMLQLLLVAVVADSHLFLPPPLHGDWESAAVRAFEQI